MEDDVQFERHYLATKDLKLKLKAPRREFNDGGHLYGSGSHKGDDFNQEAGAVIDVKAGHKIRLSEYEAEEHLASGALELAP